MNVEFLKVQCREMKQIRKDLGTDTSRNELGAEEVDAKILKLDEEIERLEIQIKKNE